MSSINAPEFARNYGFWNEDLQSEINHNTRVAIAGVGGDGYQLGLRLAMMGVEVFDVAEPEEFEAENANRVPGAIRANWGRSKGEAFREDVLKFNPNADVRLFPKGINEDNIAEFLGRATLAFDETELTKLELGTMLSDEARRKGIPDIMVMNVGFAGQVTSFHPNGKHSFRTMMGIPEGMPLDEVKDQELDLSRCLPYVPPYIHRSTLEVVQTEEGAPLPSIATGVDVAASLGQAEAFKHIAGRVTDKYPKPVWAPNMRYMDAMTGDAGTTRFPQLSFARTAAKMAIRTQLGMNAPTDFSRESRERRATAYALEQETVAVLE